MFSLVGVIQAPLTTGGAGTSTSNVTTTQVVKGIVRAVYVKYLGSPPAGTTDVTVATSGVAHPAVTILAIANAATDGWFYPHTAANLNTTGAAIADVYQGGVPIHDTVKVTIAQANDNDYVEVWLLVEE